MKRYGTIALWTFMILNLGLTAYLLIKPRTKVGYIYVEKVYDGFKGKQEIEKELKEVEAKQVHVLDTLKQSIADLDAQSKNASQGNRGKIQQQLDIRIKDYQRLVKEFSNYNSQESQKRIDGLLKQINEYVKEYGKKNNYGYIYGATGNGSLMYANESDDISEDIVKYINNKYAGE